MTNDTGRWMTVGDFLLRRLEEAGVARIVAVSLDIRARARTPPLS
jgi:hypothetical protein